MLDEPPVDYYQVTVFVVGTVCLVFPRRTLPGLLSFLTWWSFCSEIFFFSNFLDATSWPSWAQITVPVAAGLLGASLLLCAIKLPSCLLSCLPGATLVAYCVYSILLSLMVPFSGFIFTGRAPDYTVAESYWFWIWFVVALLFRVALWFLIPRVSCKHESDEGD